MGSEKPKKIFFTLKLVFVMGQLCSSIDALYDCMPAENSFRRQSCFDVIQDNFNLGLREVLNRSISDNVLKDSLGHFRTDICLNELYIWCRILAVGSFQYVRIKIACGHGLRTQTIKMS